MADVMKILIEACFGEYSTKYRTTEEGLRQVLQTKYNGNIEDFRQRFVQPTLQLLTTLQNLGFPVSTPKYQLVHLVSPEITSEAGDMFFQVGQSKPGTLSLKFTKYDNVRNVIRLQNSHVPEKDYRTAFTDQYLQDLRTLASNTGNIGDVLMRTCIVITKDGAVARVGTSSIMEETNMNVIGSMSPEQKSAIAEKLDKDPVLPSDDRDDWLALAERLEAEETLEEGFRAKMNACTAPGSPTMKLLEILGRRNPRYPTTRLLNHLRQMGRNDAVDAFNQAKEIRRKKEWKKDRTQTFDSGVLRLDTMKLSKQESGADPGLPDTADRLHSDVEGFLRKFQRSNTMPTTTQIEEQTTVPVQPVPHTVPTSVPVQPVSNTVPTTPQERQPASVPVQPVLDHTIELSYPQLVSQPQEQVSESVTVDLHAAETAPNDLQATPEYQPSDDLLENPGYPEAEAAVANSPRTFQDPQPIATHENPAATTQNGKTCQTCELENNPSYPVVSEAVIGPTDSVQLPLETGNLNSNGATGLVGQTATLTNQEYPPVERAVQSN
uniref:Uncharacterized protein n=1 Tax=Branchiostoma floridae TaxID=7739 RepID=C3Y9F6_BRAFL|eukprot:XP_002607202.1 hypothetical protein BRAFLDRAFT_68001 [Branchiostoma floridae]